MSPQSVLTRLSRLLVVEDHVVVAVPPADLQTALLYLSPRLAPLQYARLLRNLGSHIRRS